MQIVVESVSGCQYNITSAVENKFLQLLIIFLMFARNIPEEGRIISNFKKSLTKNRNYGIKPPLKFSRREVVSELERIKSLAREVLTFAMDEGGFDTSLWDRAERLVLNVKHISRLPELVQEGIPIDNFCLMPATYFGDSGLARYFSGKKAGKAVAAASDITRSDLLNLSTEVVEETLGGLLDKWRIEKINRIIVESGSNFTKLTEAMILSDARNLDDMGAAGIFSQARHFAVKGKSVSDALQDWQRKKDYQYWQARLADCFRFGAVRRIAQRRLSAAEYFMSQLNAENKAHDLEEFSVDSAFV